MTSEPVSLLDESVYFWTCNRGKQSAEVDIGSAEGQATVRRLAAEADVLIENFKVGTLARCGLDYETLAAVNPRLIYCSITGFGQTGPYRERPGYDTIVQALGGLMSITGNPDDEPGGGPRKCGVAVADQMTALYSAVAILAAVNERQRSGHGQYIDMSLLDVQVAALSNIGMNFLATGRTPRRFGNRLSTVYPSDDFRCRDGDIMLIVGKVVSRGMVRRVRDSHGREVRVLANPIRMSRTPPGYAGVAPSLGEANARIDQGWPARD